jgi:hypothetical protein
LITKEAGVSTPASITHQKTKTSNQKRKNTLSSSKSTLFTIEVLNSFIKKYFF